MATTDRMQVESGRERFRQEYPEIPAAWLLEKPYYKLRVGAFRTRQEAMAFIAARYSCWMGASPRRSAPVDRPPIAIGGLHPRFDEGRAAMSEKFDLHRFDAG